MSTGETSTEVTGTTRDGWWSWGLESRAIKNPGQRTYSATYRPAGASPVVAHPMEPPIGSVAVPAGIQVYAVESSGTRRRLFGRRKRR